MLQDDEGADYHGGAADDDDDDCRGSAECGLRMG